jgi:uncharacterized protein
LALAATLLIAFMKGACGGGFAIVGIPLLSLAMDPIAAGALLASRFVARDLFALRYRRPSTWSKPNLAVLLPGLVVGIGLGFLVLRFANPHFVDIVMAAITLAFTGLWFAGGGEVRAQPRSLVRGAIAATASGITTMVAHSGGPPVAMYLLPLGLSKALYAVTTSLFFTVGSLLKAGPWLLVAQPDWTLTALCLPACPLGAWLGWRLHEKLDQRQLHRACHALLTVTALKLLWDGLRSYGAVREREF